MAEFPKLKTGAAAQYPLGVSEAFETTVATFIDLSEQRSRDRAASARRWTVDLSLLDQSEVDRVEQFFVEQRGGFGSFEFDDPVGGSTVPSCRFDHDSLPFDERGDFDASTRIVIVEDA